MDGLVMWMKNAGLVILNMYSIQQHEECPHKECFNLLKSKSLSFNSEKIISVAFSL